MTVTNYLQGLDLTKCGEGALDRLSYSLIEDRRAIRAQGLQIQAERDRRANAEKRKKLEQEAAALGLALAPAAAPKEEPVMTSSDDAGFEIATVASATLPAVPG